MHNHILVVDDNLIQGTTRKTILGLYFEEVTLKESVKQALELLQQPPSGHSVSLIITDHLMPEMNGPEFVQAVRKSLPDIPIIVLSGLSDAIEEYEGMGVIFRSKPFSPEALIELCQELLKRPIGRTA
jgi:CheY-like chemotaxis protein